MNPGNPFAVVRAQAETWRPMAEVEAQPGVYINVRTVTTYRWLPYKPDGARQMKRSGRWQRAVGDYGKWENAELPEIGDWMPNETTGGDA